MARKQTLVPLRQEQVIKHTEKWLYLKREHVKQTQQVSEIGMGVLLFN